MTLLLSFYFCVLYLLLFLPHLYLPHSFKSLLCMSFLISFFLFFSFALSPISHGCLSLPSHYLFIPNVLLLFSSSLLSPSHSFPSCTFCSFFHIIIRSLSKTFSLWVHFYGTLIWGLVYSPGQNQIAWLQNCEHC